MTATLQAIAGKPLTEEVKREAIAIMERQALGEEADSGFDGGEFSGPAHTEILDELLCELAAKHGVSFDALQAWMNEPVYDDPTQTS